MRHCKSPYLFLVVDINWSIETKLIRISLRILIIELEELWRDLNPRPQQALYSKQGILSALIALPMRGAPVGLTLRLFLYFLLTVLQKNTPCRIRMLTYAYPSSPSKHQ